MTQNFLKIRLKLSILIYRPPKSSNLLILSMGLQFVDIIYQNIFVKKTTHHDLFFRHGIYNETVGKKGERNITLLTKNVKKIDQVLSAHKCMLSGN